MTANDLDYLILLAIILAGLHLYKDWSDRKKAKRRERMRLERFHKSWEGYFDGEDHVIDQEDGKPENLESEEIEEMR